MGGGTNLGILLRIALTSLVSHKVKSLIVGSIMIFGTFLVILGTSLLDSIERSMQESVTSSLAGHLQLHSADAKDALELFGGFGGPNADIGELDRFDALRARVAAVDNVKAVVPMGLGAAVANADSELDQALKDLRASVKDKDAASVGVLKGRVQQILGLYRSELDNKLVISSDTSKLEEEKALLERALSDAFWKEFDADPVAGLEFLDTKVAPLFGEGRLLYFRYMGTDVPLFTQTFDRFEIVRGETIPQGQRGLLIADRTYERMVKHRVAVEFDEVHEALTGSGRQIAGDKLLEYRVDRMVKQYRLILFQLKPADAAKLTELLRKELPGVEGDLAAQLQAFLKIDDTNEASRHRFFYDVIAPMIRLYDVAVGDTLTFTAFTKTGYVRRVNVRVYGTFKFRGLEGSDLAGVTNIVDMVSFRDLYGQQTDAQKAELKEIKEEVAVKDVDRGSAEDALFGGGDAVVSDASADTSAADQLEALRLGTLEIEAAREVDAPFTQQDIDQGMALNVAVILKDPDRLEETRAAILKATHDAGMEVKVLNWQEASGFIGQFVLVVRLVLWVAILIIFIVALVIINNSMVMATMERTSEIGTMRAVGAQRSFIVAMFLIETIVLGLLAGTLGGGLGVGVVAWAGSVGIPAGNDVLVFLFGGPRLHPTVGLGNVLVSASLIVGVSLVSTLYPAFLAARIQPIVAMQSRG